MTAESNENLNEMLQERVRVSPDSLFLFDAATDRSWSYSDFQRAVSRASALLIDNGVSRGDVVSLLLPNSPEYIIAYFACWHLGALAGPINSLLKADEIAWITTNSDAKLMLLHSAFHEAASAVECPKVVFESIDEVEESTGYDPAESLAADDDAMIIYTSGTTGKPKGCVLSHGNLLANARQITEWMRFGPDDRLLTVMPLFHMNAVSVTTLTAMYAGGATVVSPKFSTSRFWETIERFRITSFGSVATMLSMLLARGETTHDISSLRFAMCGSAPVPVEVLKRFEELFGVLVIEGYGLSESTCRSTFNPPDARRRPGSCGLPIGNEMRVVDENDRPLGDGEHGEIVVRGPNVFRGYFRDPEATQRSFSGGWFHTGDIGWRDPDGFFHIADRKSDMIIRGGENIYPREIDDILYRHPAVAHAAVIGVPDKLYGEEVAAFIVLKEGFTKAETQRVSDNVVTEADITDFCKLHLADYKCPKTVHFVDDIPKGPTGKLLKRELAKRFSKA